MVCWAPSSGRRLAVCDSTCFFLIQVGVRAMGPFCEMVYKDSSLLVHTKARGSDLRSKYAPKKPTRSRRLIEVLRKLCLAPTCRYAAAAPARLWAAWLRWWGVGWSMFGVVAGLVVSTKEYLAPSIIRNLLWTPNVFSAVVLEACSGLVLRMWPPTQGSPVC